MVDMQAIDTLLRLGEEYTGHAKNLSGQTVDAIQTGREQGPVQKAESDLKVCQTSCSLA